MITVCPRLTAFATPKAIITISVSVASLRDVETAGVEARGSTSVCILRL
jgi:hypothetical protein